MSGARNDTERAGAAEAGDGPQQSVHEMIEEASYRALEISPPLLSYVTGLVRAGHTPEQIVRIMMEQSGFKQDRVAYLGCAAIYIKKLESVAEEGRVS